MPTKILFVDDDPMITDTLKRVLQHEGYYMLCARSGQEALAVLQDEEFDIVVSDEMMPGMQGTDLLRTIKDAYPNTIRILVTGHPDLDIAMKAVNQGEVYRIVTKPVDAVEFAVTIRLAVERKRLFEQAQRLLQRFRQQGQELERLKKVALERQYPGITKRDVDHKGQFEIEDDIASLDYNGLVKAIAKELQ